MNIQSYRGLSARDQLFADLMMELIAEFKALRLEVDVNDLPKREDH